tara:strand:- start:786 stop:1103 length:318 start_codon:yes stop_codon:yes gene_type:complete
MQILIIVTCVLCALNLLISIAIAGSLAKVIRYVQGEEIPEEARITTEASNLAAGPLYRMEGGELVEVSGPTYDTAVLQGVADPHADGVLNRPSSKNWDGVPVNQE